MQVVLYESDGTPLQRERARQLRVHVTRVKVTGGTSTERERVFVIPSDSVVSFPVPTDLDDEMISVRVRAVGREESEPRVHTLNISSSECLATFVLG